MPSSKYPIAARARMVAICIICLILLGCQHQQQQPQPDQNRLVYRISQYYKALQARDYAKTQRFYADRRPKKHPEQSSLGSKLSLTLASYEIQSMRIDKLDAQVVMHVTVTGLNNQYDIAMIDHWQYVEDNWFVVDAAQLSQDEPPPPLDQKMRRNSIKW